MITFRLTADEYDTFQERCLSLGLRSFSEMARAALNLLLQEPPPSSRQTLESRVAELENRLQVLTGEIRNLNRAVPRTSAP